MRTLTIFSILSLFVIASGLIISPAFADHPTASVSVPEGTAVPGCEATNECYIPYEVTVDVGGEVTWTNDDTAAHTVTGGGAVDGPSGEFDSSLFMAGATFSHKFEEAGTYPYFCMVHPWMEGIVIVQEAEAEEEVHEEEEIHEEKEPMEEKFELEATIVDGSREFIDVGNSALWVEVSGENAYVSNPHDGKILVIDANSHEVVNIIDSEVGVLVLEVVPETNSIYATVESKNVVLVYDLATNSLVTEIDLGDPEIIMFSKADTPYGQREYSYFATNGIGLDYDPVNQKLYAAHTEINSIKVIDVKTNQVTDSITVGKTPLLIEIDVATHTGYVTNVETNNVSVIDLETNEIIKTLNTGFVPDQMEIDDKNRQLYVTHHASPHVTVIDLETQEIKEKISMDGPTHALALNSKDDILHVTYMPDSVLTGLGAEGKIDFINTNTNQIITSFEIEDNPFIIAINSDTQKLFATIISEGTLVAVDLEAEDIGYQEVVTEKETEEETSIPEATGGGCLIATAAYGTELAPQVQFLREIRDNTVMSTQSGAAFMTGFNNLYYSFSPTIADMERENPVFQEAVRLFITPMISTLSIMTLADQGSEAEVLGLGISVIALNLGMYFVAPVAITWKIKNHLKPRK